MSQIRIHSLVCGQVGVDPAVPNRGVSRNPVAYTGLFRSAKRRIWIPVKAFLIDHPQGKAESPWSCLEPGANEGISPLGAE